MANTLAEDKAKKQANKCKGGKQSLEAQLKEK